MNNRLGFKKFGVILLGAVAFMVATAGLFATSPKLRAQGMQLLTSLTGTEQLILNYPCTVSCGTTTSTLAGYVRGTGLLYTTTGTAGSTGTTAEQTLGSYSLPASTLNTGTKLRIGASFTAAANADTKTFKCYFGASVITSGALLTNNKNGSCEVIVTETGASKQIAYGNMLVDVTPITGYVNTTGTDVYTSPIIIKFTATQGSAQANDVILNDFYVERLGN